MIAESPEKLKALLEEYEAAGGSRGLLLDHVDPSLSAPAPSTLPPTVDEPL